MLVRNAWDVAAGAALACLAAVVPLAVSTQSAVPQARTIKLINPYPPGGTADIIARLVTEQISRTQGATFVIENRPGAGTRSAPMWWRAPRPTATRCFSIRPRS
jgi:tripartite-type tricarboxylate transporter receptor subunit TctC